MNASRELFIIRLFNSIGATTLSLFKVAGEMSILFISTVKCIIKNKMRYKLTMKQIEFIGVKSVPIVVLTGAFTGMVFGIQTYVGFKDFGAESMSGSLVALAMITELGPVLTGLMVAARVGSSIAAELGTMKVTEQIDALDAMGINTLDYLVAPRLVAAAVVFPMLNVICITFGLMGGYVVNVMFLGVNSVEYVDQSILYVGFIDLLNSLVKAFVFGLVIVTVACYKGLNTRLGAEGVGKSTTQSVVISCVLILLFDYIITTFLVSL